MLTKTTEKVMLMMMMMMMTMEDPTQGSWQGRVGAALRAERAGAASLQCPSDWKCPVSNLRPGGIPPPQLKYSLTFRAFSS